MALPNKSPTDFSAGGTYTHDNFNDQINAVYTWGQGEVDVHINATAAHGQASALVSINGTQTLTNKTLTTPVVASFYQDAAKTQLMTTPNTASDTLTANDATQTLTNKTLTTPVLASFYQDAGKTKLMTTPDTASDTLCAIAASQTLTNKILSDPQIWLKQDVTGVNASVTTGAHSVICTAGGITITLTTAIAALDGYRVTVKDQSGTAGASPITIDTQGAETIDGQASVQIVEDYGSLTFEVYNGHFYIM